MTKTRIAALLLAAILIAAVAFTAHLALDTAQVAAAAREDAPACAFVGADQASINAVYSELLGNAWPRTRAGYTGPEGGLLSLRDC